MDLALLETLNGGDLQLVGNDFAMQNSWGNMIYLALFGGNYESVTRDIPDTELDQSWWGNSLLFPNEPSLQFNSTTERTLDLVALNSSGRVRIENAVIEDLSFLSVYFEVKVVVSIISIDRIKIEIKIRPLDSLPDQFATAILIWDVKAKALGDFSLFDFSFEDFFV